jgi:threonine/homoserine efflux transporter RhtA
MRRGQAMILAVLSLGGVMLGATAVGGLLMLYQLRTVTDSENSAKAIFAADAGVEWALYTYFNPARGVATSSLGNGATYGVTCYDGSAVPQPIDCNGSGGAPAFAVARGQSLESARAFYVNFDSATTSYP